MCRNGFVAGPQAAFLPDLHPACPNKEILMNTGLRSSLCARLFQGVLVCALLLVPLATQEQTFFGSGGLTNTAPNENNVALGYEALASITTGYDNTANGAGALYSNSTGS